MRNLTLKDKKIFDRYLQLRSHRLSVYAFENIYLWKEFFEISWEIIEGNLCVFFQDKIACFLYLSPLGETRNGSLVEKVFIELDRRNKNKGFSRIENAEKEELDFFRRLGFKEKIRSYDYLCLRKELSGLSGNKFKSQRASFNYFLRAYPHYRYLSFRLKDKEACINLHSRWARQRSQTNPDNLYRTMLEDSAVSLKVALENYSELNLVGRVVKIGQEIAGFSLGFKLSADTFCILFEITDLAVKGLAQFIFRRFCQELTGFSYINVMDDSGLSNLRKVKLSYRPVRLIPAYNIKRQDD